MRLLSKISPSTWFNNLSIKNKITYLYLPLAIIPIIAFALVSTQLYEKSIVKRSLDTMASNNTLITNQIESILSQAESCSTYLTLSINNLVYHSSTRTNRLGDVKFNSLLTNELSYAKLIFKDIDSIAFVDVHDQVFLSHYSLYNDLTRLQNAPYLNALKSSFGNNIWQDISKQAWFNTSKDKPTMTLSKKIWNIQTGETIGYLFINISEERFLRLFEDQQDTYSILNKEHLIVSTNERDQLFSVITHKPTKTFLIDASLTSTLLNIDHDIYMASKRPIQHLNWLLLSEANLESYTADLRSLLILTIILLSSIILMDIAMSTVLNRWITSPIHKLIGGLETIAEGRFDYRFNMKTNDEIGLFAKRFNTMSEQIGELMIRIERQEEKKRAFELALIQEQIKPHFLYNTLDIIMKLIELGQTKKAQKATKRLADFYKHSLSGGAAVITVEEELRLTSDYLSLQKIRYSDAFDFSIDIPKEVQSLNIPKLTLQPIVENAIYHGLKYRSVDGLIKITAFLEAGFWYLVIGDNGIGIEPSLMASLNADLDTPLSVLLDQPAVQPASLKHFGIRNVNHRIKLFFGSEYGLHYESWDNNGTKVLIRLPQGERHD
jgi:two-component system sensor histidine kinase YesM